MKIISNLIEAHIFRETEKGIQFLLLKRSEGQPYPGLWQMVTGKIKPDEKAHHTAMREIEEETGLIPVQLWVAPTVNSFYEPRDEYICLIPVFAARVDKDEINLSKEHTEYRWVDKSAAQILLAWEGQRKAVQIIEDYFLNEKSFFHFVEIDLH
ncbi:MAG: NUDIX pyrophosphatase [Ignavibacteriaceae bacterium]|jgi:dATP pyrophosphohydrolase|nr:NUDIX pyrophosphatase [Ignavibacteriaceae bacterium]MCU0406406.1 NUDIX pyrophosphatase [Ignavibacteriaceae bacterium]